MQLICETQPTDDIKINMSTRTENPVNGDISDMKKELHFINKENNHIDDGTIANIEKKFNNKTESDIDRLSSDSIKEIVPREENSNEIETTKRNLEVIETIQNVDLLDNMNSQESEKTSKGQDKIELDCGNPHTITEVLLATKKHIDAEIHLKSDDHINSSKKDETAMLEVSNDRNEILRADTDITFQEPKSSSEDKASIEVLDTTNIMESSCGTVSEMSDVNKEGFENIATCANSKIIDEGTNDVSSSEHINTPIHSSKSENINTNDNVSIDGEMNKTSEILDAVFNNKSIKQNDNTVLKRESSVKHLDNFAIYEKIDEPAKVPVNIETLVEDKILDDNNLPPIDEENLDVTVHEVKTTCTNHIEDLVLTGTELEIIAVNKEALEIKTPELNLLPVIENCDDDLMSKSTTMQINDSTDADNKALVHDEVLENASTAFQENAESLESLEKTTITSDENVLICKEKEADISLMEIDDVEIVDLDKDTLDKNINKIENASNDVSSVITKIVKISELEPLSEHNKNESKARLPFVKETGIKEIENAPMEIDDVEIVDLDKETQDRNVCKTKTTLNVVSSKETNLVEKSKQEALPENNMNNSTTKVRNEDVNSKDLPTITNTAEEAENIGAKKLTKEHQDKVEIVDEDDIKIVENASAKLSSTNQEKQKSPELQDTKTLPVVCKLSNTLDILSDDEEDSTKVEINKMDNKPAEKQCINLDEDDDIMLIEEDSNSKEAPNNDKANVLNKREETLSQPNSKTDVETGEQHMTSTNITALAPTITEKDFSPIKTPVVDLESAPQTENKSEEQNEKVEIKKPLLPQNFLKTAKKNLADMTRHELEDFCILRIVESIVDRSNLSDIKTKMKAMAQNLEDYKKRAMMLTKQNRDLQVVLKSVQEEQKKRTNGPIQPLKITRSVGMQVLMNDKVDSRKKGLIPNQVSTTPAGRPARAVQTAKVPNKPVPVTPPTIPVPRKVPVNNSPAKTVTTTPANNMGNKAASPNPNGLRNPSPVQKAPEKRTHSRMQATSSVTVDLTNDEPPPKINNKNAPVPPVRVVPPQNLLASQRPFAQPLNSPRKVYIPISGPQAQNIRPGQTLMMKSVPPPGPRPRVPAMPRMQQSSIRINKQSAQRHPAPLPDAMKQYTPPTWKALPPAPDLKLSKVENGIVISWKIDGSESGYETIASYQLYAYQETTTPPCTALWKKIGDVKALPLPMACTLTQFMAGFKYYFAVRAVDIRSRLGPFSLPGSILLLNKM